MDWYLAAGSEGIAAIGGVGKEDAWGGCPRPNRGYDPVAGDPQADASAAVALALRVVQHQWG